MFDEIRKIPFFVIRDLRMLFTYKLALSAALFGVVFNLFYFVLFGSMFGSTVIASLSDYGGNYISYLLVGSIGWGFLWSIMQATSASLSEEMRMGPLESILLTPTKLSTLMIAYSIYGCLFGFIIFIILLFVGFFVFGITVFATATIYTLIVFILSIAMMTGFGMIFGGLTIWLKNIGETVTLIQSISMFFCGVYFPISVLPEYLQPIADYMPFYYSIEGLRRSLIPAYSSDMLFFVGMLIFWSVISIALGLTILHLGLIKAKKEGSLAFY